MKSEAEVRKFLESNPGASYDDVKAFALGGAQEQDGDIARLIKGEKPKTALLGLNALRTVGQGATLGFADEAIGGLSALGHMLPGGKSPGEAYSDTVEGEREGIQRYREDHPIAAPIAEIAGGLVTAIPFGGAGVGKAAVSTLPRAIATGAALGTVAGIGQGEGLEGRAKSGLAGGAAGAVTAGALGVAGKGLRKLLPLASRRGLSQLTRGAAADETSLSAIAEEAMPSPNTLGRVSSGKPLIMADYGGENLRGLTRATRTLPGAGKNAIPEVLAGRSAQQQERILGDLLETTGKGTRENVYQTMQDIIESKRAVGDDLFENVFKETPEIDISAVGDLLNRPSMKAAVNFAIRNAEERGGNLNPKSGLSELQALAKYFDKPAEVGTKISSRQAYEIKLAMDRLARMGQKNPDLFAQAMGTADRNALRYVNETRKELLKRLDENVPNLDSARKIFGGEASLQDAFDEGGDFWSPKMHPDLLARKMADMSEGERDLYSRRALEGLFDKLDQASTRNDLTKRRPLDEVPWDRKKLRLLFPSEEAFDEFKNRLAKEVRMGGTEDFVMAGSQTADKLAEMVGMTGMDMGDLLGVATGNPTGIIKKGLAKIGQRSADRSAKEVAGEVLPVLRASGQGIRTELEALKSKAATEEAARETKSLRRLPAASLLAALLAGR